MATPKRKKATKPKRATRMDAPMVSIGHRSEAVESVGRLVMAVVNSAAADTVKVAAFEAIKGALTISNVAIHGCNFQVG